ncbi:MAG: STAS domain-containing protein [Cyanobacteriota bacterium]|jgi:anti-sigma B factor antagonist
MNNQLFAANLTIFQAAGAITAQNAQDFQTRLCETLEKPDLMGCVVNMENVDFLDSAGLVALIGAFRFAKNLGKALRLSSLTPAVKIIFDVTQLDQVFQPL